MQVSAEELENVGLEVVDLSDARIYAPRQVHPHDTAANLEGLRRLAGAFVDSPETMLQELVEAAVRLCGADSAGISIEREEGTNEQFYQWIATSGVYSGFLNASLPRYPSACTVCLERGKPQLFRVNKRFFDLLGIDAAPVTDGILLPWEVEDIRGTIFIISHARTEAFDREVLRLMQTLANFAAMAIRQQRQRSKLVAQERASAAAAMADNLAHQINNPLQSLINILFIAKQGQRGEDARGLALELEDHFERLSVLVKHLLDLPGITKG